MVPISLLTQKGTYRGTEGEINLFETVARYSMKKLPEEFSPPRFRTLIFFCNLCCIIQNACDRSPLSRMLCIFSPLHNSNFISLSLLPRSRVDRPYTFSIFTFLFPSTHSIIPRTCNKTESCIRTSFNISHKYICIYSVNNIS